MEQDYVKEIKNSLEEINRHLSLIGYRLDKLADKGLLSTQRNKYLDIQLNEISNILSNFEMSFEYATKEDKNEN